MTRKRCHPAQLVDQKPTRWPRGARITEPFTACVPRRSQKRELRRPGEDEQAAQWRTVIH